MPQIPEYELAGIETIARGICIRDGKLLVCRAKGADTCYLPGGHIEFGETGRRALAREMREEAGLDVGVGEFRGCVENSFLQHGRPHAEINLVYAMETPAAAVAAREDWIEFEWVELPRLAAVKLLPEVFRALADDPRTFFGV